MSRIRKKIEKRAAELLIKAKIFDASDWDSLNLCFYSQDYYGECNEINAWNYLESLAVEATVKYVEVDMDSGYCTELGKKDDLSIIEAINIFKENYLAGKRLEVECGHSN